MTTEVLDEQKEQMQRVFQRYDRDRSGEISVQELGEICAALGLKLHPKDVERILRAIDQDRSGVLKFDEFAKLLSLRTIESVRDTSFIDTKFTLATLLVGKNSALEQWIFSTAVRQNTILGKLLWVMWYTGLILGMSSQPTWEISWEPWRACFGACSTLMLPLPCLIFPVLTVDLIKELSWQAEMWALLVLQISWLCMIIRLLRDIRILFWICLMPSILVSAVSDAYPAKYRGRFQKLFFLGLLVSMAWWCLLVTLRWNDPIHDAGWKFKGLTGSTVTASVLDVGTAMFFAVRNLWSAFLRPQEFVIIVSATQTVQVYVADLAERLSLSASSRPTHRNSTKTSAMFAATTSGKTSFAGSSSGKTSALMPHTLAIPRTPGCSGSSGTNETAITTLKQALKALDWEHEVIQVHVDI